MSQPEKSIIIQSQEPIKRLEEIWFNIGGTYYNLSLVTLLNYPHSLLYQKSATFGARENGNFKSFNFLSTKTNDLVKR